MMQRYNNKINSSNDRSNDSSLDDNLYKTGLITIGVCIIVVGIIKLFNIPLNKYLMPCMFHELTGGYCPGCGGTRAIKYLLQGNILKSIYYNPFVFYAAVIFGYYMISNTICRITKGKLKPMKYRTIYCYIAIAVIVCNFLWKNYMYFFKKISLIL